MNLRKTSRVAAFGFASLLLIGSLRGEILKPLDLWPNTAPGEKGDIGEERDMTKPTENLIAGRRVIRLGNITKPTLTVYKPERDKDTGAAVVVCPGGGYHILALDLEGTEVCEWLNSIGVTGVLLKYRVPKREGLPRHVPALQDAQRALGIVRLRAKEWRVDPARIGFLGFSAGAHLTAALSGDHQVRSYPAVDEADSLSCKPDFSILVYPGGLTLKNEGDKIAPELKISTNLPPAFIAMSADDPVRVENAMFYALALKEAKVPVDLHIYAAGGHGYGLRPSSELVTTWPNRVEEWLRHRGWLGTK